MKAIAIHLKREFRIAYETCRITLLRWDLAICMRMTCISGLESAWEWDVDVDIDVNLHMFSIIYHVDHVFVHVSI